MSTNIVLYGPPGSGKGTQAEKLVRKYNFVSIALGVLLRKKIEENPVSNQLIAHYINNGELVPDIFSFELIEKLIHEQPHDASLIFDGFPRTIQQSIFLDNLLSKYSIQIDAVIFLDVPEEDLLKRLQDRSVAEGRLDDQDERYIQKRMNIYKKETLPITTYYKDQNKLYKIYGSRNKDEITQKIEIIINGLNK